MDLVAIENEKNCEEKTEETRLLVPGLLHPPHPQCIVPPVRNDSNGLLKPESSPIRSRRSFCTNSELTGSRRPSAAVSAIQQQDHRRTSSTGNIIFDLIQGKLLGTGKSKDHVDVTDEDGFVHLSQSNVDREHEFRMKNRQQGYDALTSSLSAFYAKLMVVLGIAFPMTDVLSVKAPNKFYQGFYLYLYIGSIAFVAFMYIDHLRSRRMFAATNNNENDKDKRSASEISQAKSRLGSFYLRVGAVAFGIGSMVYSGLEIGQYFELKGEQGCRNVLIAFTPATRMVLSIVQMQFIFLNTKEFEMKRHKVIVRFGLMHMLATNLCEWLYVLVEETRHEISNNIENATGVNLSHFAHTENALNVTTIDDRVKRATASEIVVDCRRVNIMGKLLNNSSPFLFPCTIEYSLICAVILFEMWKQSITVGQAKRSRDRKISTTAQNAQHFSIDCSRAHHGMFAGILIIVLTIISLIMFYVLNIPLYHTLATFEVTICEMLLYVLTSLAVFGAFIRMRDLKFSQSFGGMPLDCTLLLLAQSGVYIYCMFSIIGCYFSIAEGGRFGLIAEIFSIVQTSMQTLFILNAWWRRCRSAQENRKKPGREIVTFLLVANMSMWSINALVKNRAMFRRTHLQFFGEWSWTIITHVSMPLAIFYRFHSTICLFEIWKTTYKVRHAAHQSIPR